MRANTQTIASSQDWISDFWICRGAEISPAGVGLVPTWEPPDALDQWPILPAALLERYQPERQSRTNHLAFAHLLASAGQPSEPNSDDAVQEFYQLIRNSTEPADSAVIRSEHIRAWLHTALGHLLASIALSPQTNEDQLIAESRRRLFIPRNLGRAPMWGVQYNEGEIGLLYNCRVTPHGSMLCGAIRIGQGQEWLKAWQWLSVPAEPVQIAAALPLAAKLLRCRPLLQSLLDSLEGDDPELENIALAVLRRWLLSLKAMAWMEDALTRDWNSVRPQDLACFAFNAVKPDWPRRSVAISHRSLDAKPVLEQLKAWTSSLFAIDANYAPFWETNTGMIWGLFAATPVLARVRSPNYQASEWCERESEMIRHLEERCDFMPGRMVLDTPLADLPEFDRLVDAWRPQSSFAFSSLRFPEFPPLSQVYVPGPELEWPLAMLRAAASLRMFHATYGDARLANRLGDLLSSGRADLPLPPPTNNPEGWTAYVGIFRDLLSECGLPSETSPLQLVADAAPWHPDDVQAFWDQVPDLRSGSPSLRDVLAALEWRTSLLPMLEEESFGDMTLVDLRELSRETWETDPRLSLARGIAALRSPPRPVWFIQLAGQGVDNWGLPNDRPIFTQYTERQFAWMGLQGYLPPDWPGLYAARCGLVICAELLQKCRDAK